MLTALCTILRKFSEFGLPTCFFAGNLAPIDIRSHYDEGKVRLAQKELAARMTPKQRARYFPKLDTYKDMVRLGEEYYKEKEKKKQALRPGVFVYRDIKPGTMHKASFSEKRGEIFIIKRVIFERSVYRYQLLNLAFKVRPCHHFQTIL